MRLPRVEDFDQAARGPRTTSRVGLWLGLAFGLCFLTGVWSHLQYESPDWAPIGPDPAWLYRVTQGTHVVAGLASIPLLLVKLWSVYPRLFLRPPLRDPRELALHLAERGSILVLVSTAIFLVATGALNTVQWYPWSFSFRSTHEATAWVAMGSLLVHLAVKLPTIRDGLRRSPGHDHGIPGDRADSVDQDGVDQDGVDQDGVDQDRVDQDRVDQDGVDPVGAGGGPTRRGVLLATASAVGLTIVLTAGQTVPWLRRISLFAVRDGEGPQGLPVNRTAAAAGIDLPAEPVVELRAGGTTRRWTRAELAALPQRTHRLPIACVEGWSAEADWTGVAVRDLLAAAGIDQDSEVIVTSWQTRGAFASSVLPADFVADPRTLLALRVNGEDLNPDHGFPARIIAPNRPGVLQTKWVRGLEVRT